jgi:HEPN domain-containing protein
LNAFERDPSHWLLRHSPPEWISAGLNELERAEAAFEQHNPVAAHAHLKRAAGMALNAALIVEPNETWGRSYVDHLKAVANSTSVPEDVRAAATRLLALSSQPRPVIALRTPSIERACLEAARVVMAHAYAIVQKGAVE